MTDWAMTNWLATVKTQQSFSINSWLKGKVIIGNLIMVAGFSAVSCWGLRFISGANLLQKLMPLYCGFLKLESLSSGRVSK